MGHLSGGIVIQGRIAGDHPAKQSHIHRRVLLQGLFVVILLLAVLGGQPGQRPGLGRAQKEQGGVVVIFQLDACIFQCLFCILF